MRELTNKQKNTADLVAKGVLTLDAIMEVYGATSRGSASAIKTTLNRSKTYQDYLKNQQALVLSIKQGEGKALVQILEEIFPKRERMEILVEIARGDDKRSTLEALKEIFKLEGAYSTVTSKTVSLYATLDGLEETPEETIEREAKEASKREFEEAIPVEVIEEDGSAIKSPESF